MQNAAVLILAGTDTHADRGRLVNGLQAAAEFAESDDADLVLLFDGAGTQWIPRLESEESDYHALYRSLEDDVAVCDYCAGAFGVSEEVSASSVPLRDEHEGHPSVKSLVDEGYEVITF